MEEQYIMVSVPRAAAVMCPRPWKGVRR